MIMRAKIKSKYLDQIITGKKTEEFRQFEAIEFTDEKGIKALVEIKDVENVGPLRKAVMEMYKDIPWIPDRPIYLIELGRVLQVDMTGTKHAQKIRSRESEEKAPDTITDSGIFYDSVDP